MLSGATDKGKPVSFRANKVRSVPLEDSNGETIGVHFTSKPGDKQNGKWTTAPVRNPDTEFSRGFLDAKKTLATKRYHFDLEAEPETAPWAQGATPKRPVYVEAHGSPEVFQVKVNLGSRLLPRWTDVRVDGETYGKILTTNEHFMRAAGASPGAPVVLASCEVGDGAMVARSAADHLHRSGAVTGDVYAPRGITSFTNENGVSDMYVCLLKRRGDGTEPGFEVFPGPATSDTAE